MTEEVQNDEVKYFDVTNVSLRLVHIADVTLAPNETKPLVDDALGINRQMVEDEESLEFAENVEKPKSKKESKTAIAAKTSTGAGWSKK